MYDGLAKGIDLIQLNSIHDCYSGISAVNYYGENFTRLLTFSGNKN